MKQSVTTLCVERDTPEKPACNPIFIALFLSERRRTLRIYHLSASFNRIKGTKNFKRVSLVCVGSMDLIRPASLL